MKGVNKIADLEKHLSAKDSRIAVLEEELDKARKSNSRLADQNIYLIERGFWARLFNR